MTTAIVVTGKVDLIRYANTKQSAQAGHPVDSEQSHTGVSCGMQQPTRRLYGHPRNERAHTDLTCSRSKNKTPSRRDSACTAEQTLSLRWKLSCRLRLQRPGPLRLLPQRYPCSPHLPRSVPAFATHWQRTDTTGRSSVFPNSRKAAFPCRSLCGQGAIYPRLNQRKKGYPVWIEKPLLAKTPDRCGPLLNQAHRRLAGSFPIS